MNEPVLPLIRNPAVDLSIIIATWNNAGDIQACLASLPAGFRDLTGEVIVVDNASTDDTAERIAANFPAVTLLRNAENEGFARANNRGMVQARGRYILLLNPDTIVEPGALQMLSAYLDEQPHVGAAGPRLARPDGTIQRSCLRFVSLRALVTGYLRGGDYLPAATSRPSRVEGLSGAALLLRRRALDEVGLLDERFFMYGEDTDICYRLNQAGWAVCYYPSAHIIHLGGQSAGQIPAETYVRRRMAQLQFVRKHGATGEAMLMAQLMRWSLRLRAARAQGPQRAYFRSILHALNTRIAAKPEARSS
ncbi:MAG: glycosyltransferase family 2 protein [Caldilineaceae bacterium]|nr:glycosyltransferase family 2 protein [Caldilineaceae bacterium]